MFQVVKDCKTGTPPVLGLPTIRKLNLTRTVVSTEVNNQKLDQIVKDYKEVFEDNLGELKGIEYEIKLAPDAVGKIIIPCRKIPFSIMKPLKRLFLKWLEQLCLLF